MKKSLYIIAVFLTACLTGCINKIEETKNNSVTQKPTDSIQQSLSLVPGITNVTMSTMEDKNIYLFYYAQATDHTNPSAGTFNQRVRLIFSEKDKPVVLVTQGYYIADNITEKNIPDLAKLLEANVVEIEHRYFGDSRPQEAYNLDFTYLYTEQAAEDIHAIVSTLKEVLFGDNKWIATGGSKGGITATLQAYYSEKKGWKDFDLYVPFCAPFLTSLQDPSVGDYLWAICPDILKRYPAAITGNVELRNICLSMFHSACADEYGFILEEYGPSEKAATCGAVWMFLENLFVKFSYIPYALWANMVPDPDTAPAEDVATFVFMDASGLNKKIAEAAAENTKSGYEDTRLRVLAKEKESILPYYVQGCRELGLYRHNYSGVDGTYVTADEAAAAGFFLDNAGRYSKYSAEWDGGALMNDVRSWVATETSADIIFVYGGMDPWTGGGVPPSVAENPHVSYILNENGIHTMNFLSPSEFSEKAYRAISNEVKARLK